MFRRMMEFLKETRVEISKISWPTRDELRESTVVVIISAVLLSIFIGAVDLISQEIAKWVFIRLPSVF